MVFAAVSLAGGPGELQEVSLVQLIINPQAYEGRRVSVRGYLTDAGGLTFLMLNREASATKDAASGIPVSRESRTSQGTVPCVGGYVTVTGVFGKMWGEISGLVDIERTSIWDLEGGRAQDCIYP